MIKVKISQIRTTLEKILLRQGLTKSAAKIVADEYLEGELEGKYSHGLLAFPAIIERLIDKKALEPKILKRTHSFIYLEANKNLGALVGRQAADLAVKMASKEGVGLALIRNMLTWLRPGKIAQYIAQKNFIGLVVNNGGVPMVAPPAGFDPIIGTNPIGIGIPTAKEPILVDMATSKRAWGIVREAKTRGGNLPPATFYGKEGNFTIKPEEAYSVVPAGDYKGFSLGLMIEILTGSLVNMPMGLHKLGKGDYRTLPRGAMILVINPQKTTSLNNFKLLNSALIKQIKASRKLKGVKEIMVPGERAAQTKQVNIKNGYLEINEHLWQQITSLANS